MGEIPWENFALCLLVREARNHLEWTYADISQIAVEAETHGIERGAPLMVRGRDVSQAVAEHIVAREREHAAGMD